MKGLAHVLILCAALFGGCLAATPELSTPRSAQVIPTARFVEDASGTPGQSGAPSKLLAQANGYLGRPKETSLRESRANPELGTPTPSPSPITRARAVASRPSGERPSVSPAGTPATPHPGPSPRSAGAGKTGSAPTGRIGSIQLGGAAGVMSWYCRPGYSACTRGHPTDCLCVAAGPTLRAVLGPHWYGRQIRVRVASGAWVQATVIDVCICGKLIDGYAALWAALGLPLSRGIVSVSVEVLPR